MGYQKAGVHCLGCWIKLHANLPGVTYGEKQHTRAQVVAGGRGKAWEKQLYFYCWWFRAVDGLRNFASLEQVIIWTQPYNKTQEKGVVKCKYVVENYDVIFPHTNNFR